MIDDKSATIEQICADVLSKKGIEYSACNFFIQAVSKRIEAAGSAKTITSTLSGQANDIAGRLKTVKDPWIFLDKDPDLATKFAEAGYLVIGGLAKASGSGHVFIVVKGGPSKKGLITPWGYPSRGGAPMAHHGSTVKKLQTTSKIPVDHIFTKEDEANVIYGAIQDPRTLPKTANTKIVTAQAIMMRTMGAGKVVFG